MVHIIRRRNFIHAVVVLNLIDIVFNGLNQIVFDGLLEHLVTHGEDADIGQRNHGDQCRRKPEGNARPDGQAVHTGLSSAST